MYSQPTGSLCLVPIGLPVFLPYVSVPFSKGVPITASVNLRLSRIGFAISLAIWSHGYRSQITRTLYSLSNLLETMLYNTRSSVLEVSSI